mgnify:CR=1 FL=1
MEEVNAMPPATFVEQFGGVYEHSPWVAAQAARSRPFGDIAGMCQAFSVAMRGADEADLYALVRAHPELGHRLGVDPGLTAASAQEQGGAGLDRLTPEEYAHFRALNDAYTQKFGMPFVICVRKVGGHAKQVIAQAMERRLASTPQAELAEALHQIDAIAALRLHDKVVA